MPRPERDRSAASRSPSRRTDPAWRSSASPQARDALERRCRRADCRTTSSGVAAFARASRQRPIGVEVLQREADRIHRAVAAWRTSGFARCCAIRSRIDERLATRRCPADGGTFGGGGGGGMPRRLSSTHLPRSTGEVRFAYDVTVRMLPCPSSPRALAVLGRGHAAEVAAVDARDAVVPREPLVQERVVGASAAPGRCGPRCTMLSKNSSVSRRKRLAQVVVEIGKQSRRPGRAPRGCAGAATGRRSWSTSASARGSASMRRTCRSSTAGCRSSPRSASVEQLVVGNAAPEEERQPRRERRGR